MESKQIVAIAVGVLVVAVVVTGIAVYYSLRIRGHGSVKTIGCNVFRDLACMEPVGEIDWGVIPQGGSSTVLLYVKNTGNSYATLTLRAENWDPAGAVQYMTLSWDVEGVGLSPNERVGATFRLDVAENVTGITDFSFDVVVTATG